MSREQLITAMLNEVLDENDETLSVGAFDDLVQRIAALTASPQAAPEVSDAAVVRAIKARNDYLREHPGDAMGGMRAALASPQVQGVGAATEPDGYTAYGEFRWAADCNARMKNEWTPVYLAPQRAPGVDEIAAELCRLNGCTEPCECHQRWARRIAALASGPSGVES